MAPRALRSGWSVPARWRGALTLWALTVALAWPIVALREIDFLPAVWNQQFVATSATSGPLSLTVTWTLNVATILGVGILWFDWLFAAMAGDAGRFRRFVLLPLAASAVAASAVAAYQVFGDLLFLNNGLFGGIGRASGTMLDANAFGAVEALASAGFLAWWLGEERARAVARAAAAGAGVDRAVGLGLADRARRGRSSRSSSSAGGSSGPPRTAPGGIALRASSSSPLRRPSSLLVAARRRRRTCPLVGRGRAPARFAPGRVAGVGRGVRARDVEPQRIRPGRRRDDSWSIRSSASASALPCHGVRLLARRRASTTCCRPTTRRTGSATSSSSSACSAASGGSRGSACSASSSGGRRSRPASALVGRDPSRPRSSASRSSRSSACRPRTCRSRSCSGRSRSGSRRRRNVRRRASIAAAHAHGLDGDRRRAGALRRRHRVCGAPRSAARAPSPRAWLAVLYGFSDPGARRGRLDVSLGCAAEPSRSIPAPKPWMRLTVSVNHLDIATHPVDAKVWCDDHLVLQTTLRTTAPGDRVRARFPKGCRA